MAKFDGILEIGFDTAMDLERFLSSDEWRQALAEEHSFVDGDRSISLITDETLLWLDPLGEEHLISERG